jgi:hypothetical protein
MFEIGDYVGTVIEGPIVGERMDERGLMFKVRYEDAEGFVRTRWLYPEEIVEVDEGEGDCCESAYVTRANASLH